MLERDPGNPLLLPSPDRAWESVAAFNPCVVAQGGIWHLFYRAEGPDPDPARQPAIVSCIGHATSTDGRHYAHRHPLVRPELTWERHGCEDPRATLLDGRCHIFYTALSTYPFEARGIRVGVAITDDYVHVDKHPVTPFNAKAMALFPERIGGRLAAVLNVHTDQPPAKIALAWFDRIEDLWNEVRWLDWYRDLDHHVIPLMRDRDDQVEVGAAPVRVPGGWLLVYSHIRGYRGTQPMFGVEAVLLDAENPARVRARTAEPLLAAHRDYEIVGRVRNVVFPSGAVVDGEMLRVYYGGADTVCCTASMPVAALADTWQAPVQGFEHSRRNRQGFERWRGNPVITPRPEFAWEARATFNPAAIQLGGRVHLLYRAMSADGTSSLGHASSADGVNFDERSSGPVYEPRAPFESRHGPGNCGCEDPRLSVIDDEVHLFYTAYDGRVPRVATSRIAVADFLRGRWNWRAPIVITAPDIDDKDACVLPRRIDGRYVIFHRTEDHIRISRASALEFGPGRWLDGEALAIRPRKEYWDNRKFGIAAPPLETAQGWLLFFHRVTRPVPVYKIEAMLLDRDDPARVIAETGATLLEPETPEECVGEVPNVVFPCGAVQLGDMVYLYYGGADRVVCVARMALAAIIRRLGL